MKFSELNKDQKKLVFLGVGGAITVLMVLSNLVINPAKIAAEEAQTVIDELAGDVNRGEMLLQRDPRVRKDVREDALAILEIYEEAFPPEDSRYGWALDQLIEITEELGFPVSVREARGARYIPLRPLQPFDDDSVSMWVPYAVEVEFQSSFENLKKFIRLLDKKNPYCSVAKLEITAQESDKEHHMINLILEWPVFRFEEDLTWIKNQVDKSKK